MLLKTGAIYTLLYSRWKTNFKIYAFVLFGNPIIPKIHALNLGARQLTTIERAKLIHVINRLSKIPNINKYTGNMLYRILLTYCRKEVRKCYRTYFHQYVIGASILNYGLRTKEEFTAEDYKTYNKMLYEYAKKDYLVTLLNMYSRRGVNLKHLQDALSKTQTQIDTKKQSTQNTSSNQTQQQQQEQTKTTTTTTTTKTPPKQNDDEFGNMGY